MNSIVIYDVNLINSDTFTFLCDAHSTTLWLDHCVSTTTGHSVIKNINASYDYISSDHFPINIVINCKVNDFINTCVQADSEYSFINWKTATEYKLNEYETTDRELSDIAIPLTAINCRDKSCATHEIDINNFYNNIIDCLRTSADICIPNNKFRSHHNVPGWNDFVKDYHNVARDNFKVWVSHGKPRQCHIYNEMKISRTRFKYTLRNCKK